MRLLPGLLAVCDSLFSSAPSKTPNSNRNITITFDDLPPALRLSPIPPTYNHLSFSSFSVFAPHSPLLKDYITPYDLNCAGSSPNALVGSRPWENGPAPSFEIANATAMVADEGLQPYFTLRSLQLKPMAAPEPGTRVWLKGFRHGGGEEAPLMWDVEFPSGYHRALLVDLVKFSKQSWERLYKVEIGADFGYDAMDWEFCVDDVELEFDEIPDRVGGRPVVGQKILGADW